MKKDIESETISDFETFADLLSELSLSITVEEVALLICERGREIIGADGVAYVIPVGDDVIFLEESAIEPLFKGLKIPIDQCVSGWCLTNNDPAFVADVIDDERTDSELYTENFVTSLAMIPVRNPEPIAAIGFYFASAHDFPKKEMRVMQCLAAAAEFAMRNINTMTQIDQIVSERTKALENVNSELETFAFTVSHDLKNPLSVVKTNCWTVLELMTDEVPDKARQCVARIDAAAERMKGQIDGMLAMYRLTKEKIEPVDVDLSLIAKNVAEELRSLDPGRQVEFEISDNLEAYGDERMFHVLIENLLSNSWKYSVESNPAVIEFFSKETEEDGVVFCIRDNGQGFAMEDSEKIFGVFQRLPRENRIEGHGIGLASVKRIINKHGGRVWAEGEPGKGATFSFTLPLMPLDSTIETFIEDKQSAEQGVSDH